MRLDFKRNLGPLDRVFRVVLGIFLIVLAFNRVVTLQSYALWILYFLGISQIIEGAVGY